MRKNLLGLIFGLIVLSSFILATNIQPGGPPKIFSGEIYVNETHLKDGNYSLRAVINGEPVAISEIINYEYENLQVSTGDSNYYGEIIFMVNGIESLNKSSWYNREDERGEKVILDLYFDKEIPSNNPCGNGDLNSNAGEQCDGIELGFATCENVMSLYYGRSGYSGELACTSECIYDVSNCTAPASSPTSSNSPSSSPSSSPGGGSPTTYTATSTSTPEGDSGTEESEGDSQLISTEETKDNQRNFFSTTGNAIAGITKTKAGKGVLLVAFLVVVIGAFFSLSSKKNEDEKSGKKAKQIKVVKMSELAKKKK